MIGSDEKYMMFICPSFTTDEVYEIWIDKETGVLRCSCLDSTCRHKQDKITNESKRLCKHGMAVLRLARLLD